jgi:hypothetical protein
MDELDNLASDPLGSPAPSQPQISKALGLLADLLDTVPARTQRWERRDRGNGVSYRLWDALPLVHAVAAAHLISEQEAVHAVQAAVRRIKTDDGVIDVVSGQLGALGVGSLKDLMGRTIELETHHPLNLGAYALSMVDSDAMQAACGHTARVLGERSVTAQATAA